MLRFSTSVKFRRVALHRCTVNSVQLTRHLSVPSAINERYSKIAIGTMVVTAVAAVRVLISNYSNLKEVAEEDQSLFPLAIADNEIKQLRMEDYVPRTDLLRKFELIGDENPDGCYYIVFGAKGSGKSTVVQNAFAGRKGVVNVRIFNSISKDEIALEIAKSIIAGKNIIPKNTSIQVFLIENIQKCPTVPTIIFDVEKGPSSDPSRSLEAIRSITKSLAEHCHCVIILSEANAALEFRRDTSREEFIFVDEMTDAEGRVFLEKLFNTDRQKAFNNDKQKLTDDDLNYIFSNLGKNPAKLRRLKKHVRNRMGVVSVREAIEEYVEMQIQRASTELKLFPHPAILKALQQHPEGVPCHSFQGITDGSYGSC